MKNYSEKAKIQNQLLHSFFVSNASALELPENSYYKFVEAVQDKKQVLADKKEANRAANKRARQTRENLNNRLSFQLGDFKNNYFKRFVDFRINELAQNIEDSKTYIEENKETLQASAVKVYERRLKKLEEEFSRKSILSLEFLSEANKNYTTKFNRLIEKLADSGINSLYFEVKAMNSGIAYDFGFLISDDEIEVEARFIYAQGEINALHFRFIITKRNK